MSNYFLPNISRYRIPIRTLGCTSIYNGRWQANVRDNIRDFSRTPSITNWHKAGAALRKAPDGSINPSSAVSSALINIAQASSQAHFQEKCRVSQSTQRLQIYAVRAFTTSARKETRLRNIDAIDRFFANYPGFNCKTKRYQQEYVRLIAFMGWEKNEPEERKAWSAFRKAQIDAFGSSFGTSSESYESWKKICATAGISPIPTTVRECKNVWIPMCNNF